MWRLHKRDRRSLRPLIFFRAGLVVCGVLLLSHAREVNASPSVAFFYGADAPFDELRSFDIVVVEPDHGWDPQALRTDTSQLFAYVSVGEIDPTRKVTQDIPQAWLKGENAAWGSRVVDQTQPDWPTFFIERLITPLWQKGYRGFFLDTLDSYQLIATTPQERRQQENGLRHVITSLKATYPDAKLIFNRGFEILPQVHTQVYAVAAESLFRGWDPLQATYVDIPTADRRWLLDRLTEAKTRYGLHVIVLDYVAPKDRQQARKTAEQILALGMIPWVSTPEQDLLGVGAVEVLPRKILLVYNLHTTPGQDLIFSDAHRFIDFPLSYMGYVPEYWDVGQALPHGPLIGRYAGIVIWLNTPLISQAKTLHRWLTQQLSQGMRVVVFGNFGFPLDNTLLHPLHLELQLTDSPPGSPLRITVQDDIVGYEVEPHPQTRNFVPLRIRQGTPLLQLANAQDVRYDAIAYTPWGGYAQTPYIVTELPSLAKRSYITKERWLIHPFRFLSHALKLPALPAPDVTTENGRRLMLVHIDGDGFVSRAERYGAPFAGQVLLKEVLQKYRIPTTVSIVQAEIAADGVYPQYSPALEAIARETFALPFIEIATHSYSHPFWWKPLEAGQRGTKLNMQIKGYDFDLDKEIQGSIDYINQRLAPPGKSCQIFLWTGDCNPSALAVEHTYQAGVLNMNFGDTLITTSGPTLASIAPLGIKKGEYYQVYAPNQNENVYTNGWTGPYYGFQRVIETFELTEQPVRYKPINIYYHYYSAAKQASLNALHSVYRWALKQPVFNIYASEYIRKVLAFRHVEIVREMHAERAWRIRGAEQLRQLRLPQSLGYPDFARSRGVIGFQDHNNTRYIHLSGEAEARLVLTNTPPQLPYLVEANAKLTHWEGAAYTVQFGLTGHQPLSFQLFQPGSCRVRSGKRVLTGKPITASVYRYQLQDTNAPTLSIHCDR